MNSPLVSIIIPVFNTGDSAKKLTRKLLDNEYNNVEIILVDDGSIDDSLGVLREENDKRIKIYNKENGGPSSARNYGIQRAKGEYLLFIDSDDDVAKDFVSKMVLAFKNDVSMVVSGVRYCKIDSGNEKDVYLEKFEYKNNESNKDFMLRSLLHDGRMYPAFNKIFKTEIVKKYNLKFDEKMSFGEDTKFVMDYIDVALCRIGFILEPLYIYRAGTSTSTARKMQSDWKNWQRCYKNLKKWVGNKPTLEQKNLLNLIYLKWRASWFKAKFF